MPSQAYSDFCAAWRGSNCQRCRLCDERAQLVLDRGTPGTGLVIVGEAPGQDEDREGRCFVGKTGRYMDAALREVGINSDVDCLMMNSVLCWPGKTAKGAQAQPPEAALRACRPRLVEQLRLAEPKVVALAGKYAVAGVLGLDTENERPITQFAGRPVESSRFPGIVFLPMFHPSYASRNVDAVSEYTRQMRVLAALVKNILVDKVPYTWCDLTGLGPGPGYCESAFLHRQVDSHA